MKRKASAIESKKISTITPWQTPDDKKGSFDTSSPDVLLQSILGATDSKLFFTEVWERKPLHVTRNDEKFYGEFFTLPVVKSILKTNEFKFLLDVNAFIYADGQKNEFIEENYAEVTSDAVDRLLNEKKASLEFSHPQRYIDDLWNILEKLETYFGCLWNANAYFTPTDRKSAPPHCDDVENFILQTEGTSEWKLYKPMVELSRDFTQDVDEETLGEPMHTMTVETGDMLYFPRGVVYQCKASDKGHSTHVTLSTYQENAWGDFLIHAVQQALETALEKDVHIRSGLPINFRGFLGTAHNMDAYVAEAEKDVEQGETDEKKSETKTKTSSNMSDERVVKFKEEIQQRLSNLVDHLDINKSADAMCAEFMASRLPPYGYHRLEHDVSIVEECGTDAMETAEATVTTTITEEAATVETTTETTEVTSTTEPSTTEVTATETITPADPTSAEEVTTTTPAQTAEASKVGAASTVSLTDQIRIKYPDHFRVVFLNEDDDDDDDWSDVTSQTDSQIDEDMEEGSDKPTVGEPEGEQKDSVEGEDGTWKVTVERDEDDDADADADCEQHIEVLHSLTNDRYNHMGFSIYSTVGKLRFDVSYAKALVALSKSKDFVSVSELLVETDSEKLSLVSRLSGDGLLEVKSTV